MRASFPSLALAVILSTGCPHADSPPEVPVLAPQRAAPREAQPRSEPSRKAQPRPEPPRKAQPRTEPPRKAPPRSEPPRDVDLIPAPEPLEPEASQVFVLAQARRAPLTAKLSLGLVAISIVDGEAVAELSLSEGPISLRIDAPAGLEIPVADGLLEVVQVDAAAVHYRWIRSPSPNASLLLGRIAGRSAELGEVGFYRLPAGRGFVGVGNVLPTQDGNHVTISIYPATYRSDPMQGYDLHPRAQARQTLKGKVTVELQAAELPGPGRSGYVGLRLR